MLASALAVAPLRISFAGGGSDISDFYHQSDGYVVSSAINKYVYVHAKLHDDSFGEKYRISYSQIELATDKHKIKNDIVRSCLEFLEFDRPVQISTLSDLPAGTGLGSSSSFTVAVLLSLHTLEGRSPTKEQLAEEACWIEINMLGHPIGKQDQYASAFGGLNFMKFQSNSRVQVKKVSISDLKIEELMNRSRLVWTGIRRDATDILSDQKQRFSNNENALQEIANSAVNFYETLISEPLKWPVLAEIVKYSWSYKQSLSPLIATPEIQQILQTMDGLPNCGMKLLGAGGGGFIYILNGDSNEIEWDDLDFKLNSFSPKIDREGARIISVF